MFDTTSTISSNTFPCCNEAAEAADMVRVESNACAAVRLQYDCASWHSVVGRCALQQLELGSIICMRSQRSQCIPMRACISYATWRRAPCNIQCFLLAVLTHGSLISSMAVIAQSSK